MPRTTNENRKVPISALLPAEVIEAADAVRGETPRGVYIERLIRADAKAQGWRFPKKSS